MRRRRGAGAALLVIAGAVVAAVALAGNGGSPGHAATVRPPARAARRVIRDGPRGTESVPILIYHVILPAPAGAPFPGLYVPPAQFAAQMHALAAAGYHAVTMDQMWDNWHHGTPLPPGKPIVISFDNGYESQYRNALGVLRSLGWAGVENLQLSGLPPSQGGLSQREIRGLVRAGWELDTQGYSHAMLISLDAAGLRFQIADTRERIRALYHVAVNWFCYPSGQYTPAVIAAVRAAGFRGATTVVHGWANPREDPFRLPRFEVLAGTSPASLLTSLDAIRGDPPPGPSYTA